MKIIFQTYVLLCLFRLRPQDLPADKNFFFLSAVLYTFSSIGLSYPGQSLSTALFSSVTEITVLLGMTYCLLLVLKMPARFCQTGTALSGSGFVFNLSGLPFFYWQMYSASIASGSIIPGFLLLLLIFWNLAVMGHILRHALSSSFVTGLLTAMAYIWLLTSLINLIAPPRVTL